MRTISSIIALSLALPVQQALSAATCSDYIMLPYNGTQDTFTQPYSTTFAVSKGVVCDSDTSCYTAARGYVTAQQTLNITITQPILHLIHSTTNIDFLPALTGEVPNNTWPIPSGNAGYIGFTPILNCTRGTLSGCNSDEYEGVGIEACTPFGVVEGGISGFYSAVATSREDAQALVCNPAETERARQGQSGNTCTSEDEISGGQVVRASMMSMFGAMFLLIVAIVAFPGA